jgi:probable rRNA maturation factor
MRRRPAKPPLLALSLQFADPRHRALLPRHRVARWLRAALGGTPAELAVRIVDAEEGQRLNREFRHKDYATNVLTFDYAREPAVVADLVLCAPVVEAEAVAQDRPLEAHYAHLVVHGALHALGYDHEVEADAEAMEARESELLCALGYADPHSPTAAGH